MLREINPYLNFGGDAAAAIAFYEKALGAVPEGVLHWRDMPGDEIPAAMADKVMHACISVSGRHIYLSDVPPHIELARGNSFGVTLEFERAEDLELLAALAEGGTVDMAVETTFWNARFGKLTDRFGVSWLFNCQLGEVPTP